MKRAIVVGYQDTEIVGWKLATLHCPAVIIVVSMN